MSGSAAQAQAQLIAANAAIRQNILSNAQEMFQPLATGTIVPANQPSVLIPLRNVGLIKGFWVEITAVIANTGTAAASKTAWNAANLVSNFTFTDYDNYQRINTTGKHMHVLNTVKEGFPFAASLLSSALDTPIAYGNLASTISCPATIAASGNGTVKMAYYVPLAYAKQDLRGAVFGGVTSANAYLQITPNANPGAGMGDPSLAVFSGASTTIGYTSYTYNIYQIYLDQLPPIPNGQPGAGTPQLPPLDISTQYRLGWVSNSGLTAGQDFPIVFTNFQDFLSLYCEYDQAGTFNSGTDINYFTVSAANTLQLFKRTALTQMALQRIKYKVDLPPASYLFDFRDAPISTNQTGNMQLVINPITAAAGSNVFSGFESFAMVNTVLGAASLPAS